MQKARFAVAAVVEDTPKVESSIEGLQYLMLHVLCVVVTDQLYADKHRHSVPTTSNVVSCEKKTTVLVQVT